MRNLRIHSLGSALALGLYLGGFALPSLAANRATLETRALRLEMVATPATCTIQDKRSNVTWGRQDGPSRFGRVTLLTGGTPRTVDLSQCEVELVGASRIIATFHPHPETADAALRVSLQLLPEPNAVQVEYDADPGLTIQNLSVLEHIFAVTGDDGGAVLVPVREGLLIPADSGLAFTHRFDTYAYEGCHMRMFGAIRRGSAILITWPDNYAALEVASLTNSTPSGPRQTVTPALSLRKTARSFQVRLLGAGDHVAIARAYRLEAEKAGWVVPWERKLKEHPDRAKLFGAINFKLWSTLDRRMNQDSTKEESVRVNWTFAEAAQVAEHLKRDLELDKVLFTIGGWIHRGYDNQHPDILPAAPECGGNPAFADCARRIKDLGYLFCLHDNYQDMYRDSPSWDEKYIMRNPNGQLSKGGHWAGGVAYLTCSKMAVELARRPQNLAAVQRLTGANSYFIDTTYAAGLQECFDPAHPLTRADDLRWKQALSDYAREVFGVFGSECGREWALPHSDFFEGLTGVSGTYYHDVNLLTKVGGAVVPLFELVYRDGIALYGKYGYDPARAAGYVLHHLVLGRPLNYHNVPNHLYWTRAGEEASRLGLRPALGEFTQLGPRQFRIAYRWLVETPAKRDYRVFVHFTDNSGAILFQNDHDPNPPVSAWQPGQVPQGPFTITVPAHLNGTFNVRIGLFNPDSDERALLQGRDNGERAYSIGRLQVSSNQLAFQASAPPPVATGDAAVFTRGDGGWTAELHPFDRFVKNTYEILSPLNELTSKSRMEVHEFLTADRLVQKSTFGQGPDRVTVVANASPDTYVCKSNVGGEVKLPPFGFLVESLGFVAFHASSWGGIEYAAPVLFTARSLDNRPVVSSAKTRIYHGFGDARLQLGKRTHRVERQAVVSSAE